ncbi:MAG TPA: TIGR01212 family radical SAM protein [Candidatus Alectryocaccobium stercorigallinarum]|nr:TIGR01212 family radical SAM protein [Candidatus Alectryocaccobium stercorigallinarum]
MYTVNDYCRDIFGEKIYKISLNGGMTCPNRDGTLGTEGCIFCSAGGSGDFAVDFFKDSSLNPATDGSKEGSGNFAADIPDGCMTDTKIKAAKQKVKSKYKGSRFIAYFQAYTNTYAPADYLRRLYMPVIKRDDIAALSIATRPDCLPEEVLDLIEEMNKIKPVWVELGLQTANDKTAEYIRRGYKTAVYDKAVKELNEIGVHTITHVILGLPGEGPDDMVSTVRHVVSAGSRGIKLQLLHVLKGTDLEKEYLNGNFKVLEFDEYLDILEKCVSCIPDDVVIHRLTGDGPKKLLVAPLWSADKKRVLNAVKKRFGI